MTAPVRAEAELATFVPDGPRHRDHIRSPVDVLRLAIAALLVVAGVFFANLFDSTLLGLSDDGATTTEGLPSWVRQVPPTLLTLVVASTVIGDLMWALIKTRFRRFFLLLGGAVVAGLLSVVVGELIYAMVDGPVQAAFDDADVSRFRQITGRVRPGDPLLTAAVAVVAVSTSWSRRVVTQRLALVVAGYALVSLMTTGVPALSLMTDIGLGLLVGSALLLMFGRHDLAPDRDEIHEGLGSVGTDLVDLGHLDADARASAPWVGLSASGERVFVKAVGRDERSADLMFRAYRWARFRKTGDHRPFVSLRRAVEHEALVALQARALGVRTPRIVGVATAGVDGMVLAHEAIEGRSADTVEDISDEALESIWSMVSQLHSKRIAHRDLRLANILLDEHDQPWLIDFGFSELAASDQQLGTDVAELLASTAALVGAERTVRAAHVTSGVDELARALPWLQPLALSRATREAVGGEAGLEPIRTVLIERCQIPAEEPAKLERVDGKSLFIVATIALSSWFVFPQLADIDNIWAQVRTGSLRWGLVAVAFSVGTYAAATTALLGAIPVRLRYAPAFTAQLASSFANRVTPARVGGVATNVRYFQQKGVPVATSVTAVGLNAVAGVIMHAILTLAFLLLAGGDRNSGGLPVPSPVTVAVGLAVAALFIALSLVVGFTRRLIVDRVLPQLRTGWESLRQIGRSPGRLALLFGGSAMITLAYMGAMAASLAAFGSTASLPVVGLLYLTGAVVANAAPTPGGLGATEAALIAALSLVEDAAIVVPAVFLFRFVTFWLPILPGWLALTYLRQTDQL